MTNERKTRVQAIIREWKLLYKEIEGFALDEQTAFDDLSDDDQEDSEGEQLTNNVENLEQACENLDLATDNLIELT